MTIAEGPSGPEEADRSLSTVPPDPEMGRLRRARAVRRACIVVLVAFLALGAVGALGVREGKARANGGGYELEVSYPSVTRPGLAVSWSATIRRPGGFQGPVTIATTSRYLSLFDESVPDPSPATSRADAERVIWELEPPQSGDTIEVSLNTSTTPNLRRSAPAVTAVLEEGRPVVQVSYRTRMMP